MNDNACCEGCKPYQANEIRSEQVMQGDQVNIDVKQSWVEYLVTDTRARNASYDL